MPRSSTRSSAVRSTLPPIASSTKSATWSRLALFLLVGMVALRPIVNDDFWWTLSHGRAVVDGHLSPNRFLLAGDTLAEAPWLQGTPFFMLYLFGGVLSLMALKIAVLAGVAARSWQHGTSLPEGIRLAVTASLVVAVQSACGPTVSLWDALGLMITLRWTRAVASESLAWEVVWWSGLSCVWSNFGALSILVCLPLATEALGQSRHHNTIATQRRRWLILLGAAWLGSSLTPRGPFTAWDSLRQLAPWLVESRYILDQSPWTTLWNSPLEGVAVGWAILTLAVLVAMLRSRSTSRGEWVLMMVVQCVGVWSAPSAVILSVWLADRVVEFAKHDARTLPVLLQRAAPLKHTVLSKGFCVAARLTCLCVGGMAALGVELFSESRCGWGLSRQLEDREFSAALGPTSRTGTVHCADILSAGMLTWTELPNLRPYLVPRRALLCGTLRDEVLLSHELETGWQQRHIRSDATAGGWWLTLQSRRTVLIATSARRTPLIRGLEATLWKPMSLDSPVIPFALAGDPEFTPGIVRVLPQRELVDRGTWTYQGEPAEGNDRLLDIVGWITGWPDSTAILRLSRVLRAMNLPQAAMRVLTPSLSSPNVSAIAFDRSLHHELLACQIALADRRQLICGEVDEFRQTVLDRLVSRSQQPLPPIPSGAKSVSSLPRPTAATESRWTAAVEQYLRGNARGAAELLVADDPAMMSARASLLWEAGLPAEAHAVWTALVQQFPESRLALVGRHALDSADY